MLKPVALIFVSSNLSVPSKSVAVIPILGNCEPTATEVPLAPVKNA